MTTSVLRLGFQFSHDPPLTTILATSSTTPGPHPSHQLPTAVLCTQALLFVCSPYLLSSNENKQGDLDFHLAFSPSSCRFISKLTLICPSYATLASKDFLSSHFDRLEELTICLSGSEGYFEDESVVVEKMSDVDEVFAKRKSLDGNCLNCLSTMTKHLRVLLLDGFDPPLDHNLLSTAGNDEDSIQKHENLHTLVGDLFRPLQFLSDTLEVFKLSTNRTATVQPLVTEHLRNCWRLRELHFYSCQQIGKVIIDDMKNDDDENSGIKNKNNDSALLTSLPKFAPSLRSFAFADWCFVLRPEFFQLLFPMMINLEYLDLYCDLENIIYRRDLNVAAKLMHSPLTAPFANTLRSLYVNCEDLNSDFLFQLVFGVSVIGSNNNNNNGQSGITHSEQYIHETTVLFEKLKLNPLTVHSESDPLHIRRCLLTNIGHSSSASSSSSTTNTFVGDFSISPICQILEVLHLSNYSMLSDAEVVCALSLFENLRDLQLILDSPSRWDSTGSGMTSKNAMRALNACLMNTKNPRGVESLWLTQGSNLEKDCLEELAPCIHEHHKTLRHLNLQGGNAESLSDRVLQKMFEPLFSNPETKQQIQQVALETINFGTSSTPSKMISDATAELLGKIAFANLKELDLSNCVLLTSTGLEAICSNASIRNSVRKLDLVNCKNIASILPLVKLRRLQSVSLTRVSKNVPVGEYEVVLFDSTSDCGGLFHLEIAVLRNLPIDKKSAFQVLFAKIREQRKQLNLQYSFVR